MLGDWATFFLALLVVPVLVIEETASDPVLARAALVVNALIWAAFALDYLVELARSGDRRAYVASHWADLALIAVTPPALVPVEAQALRVLRVFRLLRALAVIGIAVDRVHRPLSRRALLAVLALLAAVLLLGGVLIVAAEPGSFGSVAQGYAWAVATLVTGGQATPAPTTAAGRAISTGIVVLGLGCIAALAASIAGRPGR